MPEFDSARPAAANLQRLLEFETLLSEISAAFIDLSPGDLNRQIEETLRRLCKFLGTDFAVLWQWSPSLPLVISPTHYVCAQQDVPPPGPMSQEQYPWVRQQLLAGKAVVVRSLEEMPAEAFVDRETCRVFGIRSAIALPLSLRGEPPFGALGLNSLAAERDWPEPLLMRLQLVSQILTHALAHNRHELRLTLSEARLAAGAELVGLAFYEVDFGSGAVFVDDRMRLLCGIPTDCEQSLPLVEFWMQHLHPDDSARVLKRRGQLQNGSLSRLSVEYRYLHPTLGERWIHHLAGVAQRDAAGRPVKTYGVLRDVTESKRAEEERRDLARRLIRAQEEERAMLARELHDDLTQRLAVLAIEVGRAEQAATDGAQAQTMQSIREGLVRLSEDVHALASQLHPSVLEELGLAEALRAEGERLSRQGGIDLTVRIAPLPAVVGKAVALCLFRVAQESLSNVIRHAGARAASVDLQPMDGGLLLAVRDDGVGFNEADPGKRRSLGLLNMKERVRLLNGTLDIESAPGRGTSIVAWLPAEVGD